MTKLFEIKNCQQCPNFCPRGYLLYICWLSDRNITPGDGIPKWCELPDAKWILFEEFDLEPNEGWCWITYKGRVVEAYRDYTGTFKFSPYSENCYLNECISHAQLMIIPTPPDKK